LTDDRADYADGTLRTRVIHVIRIQLLDATLATDPRDP